MWRRGGGSTTATATSTDTATTATDNTTTGTTTTDTVTLSGTIADTSSSKPSSRSGLRRAALGGCEVKIINAAGAVIGTATADDDGTFSVDVSKGSNYVVRARKGNVVLKKFVRSASENASVTVDPASSAEVKVLGKKLGHDDFGEEENDASSSIELVDVDSMLTSIALDTLVSQVTAAIVNDIKNNADYTASTVSVGVVSAAGDDVAETIALNIVVTINVVTTTASGGGSSTTGTASDTSTTTSIATDDTTSATDSGTTDSSTTTDTTSVNDTTTSTNTNGTDTATAATASSADTTAPSGTIEIKENSSSTDDRKVKIHMDALDDAKVIAWYASEDGVAPSAVSSRWRLVTPRKHYVGDVWFTLSADLGEKTVCAWFRDAAGNVSAAACDTIELEYVDTTPPSDVTVSINGGDASTTDRAVTLSVSGTDDVGITGYYVSESSATPMATAAGWVSIESAKNFSADIPFNLSAGTGTKSVYVWLIDSAGNVSGVASDSVSLVIPAPSGLSATISNGQVTLTWNGVDGAVSYSLYYGTSPGVTTDDTKVEGVSSPHAVNGLESGTTYYFALVAMNGNGESAFTGEVSASLIGIPGGVAASAGDALVIVSWNAVGGAASYNLYYGTSPDLTTSSGTMIPNVVSPYLHAPLSIGATYYYVVTAVNAGGESPASEMVSATPFDLPTIPTVVSAVAGNGSVTITWNAVAGVSAYNLYYGTSPGVTVSTGTKVAGVTSPYTLSGLANGTTYWFILTATNAYGEGVASAESWSIPQIPGTWRNRTSMPTIRSNFSTHVVNNKIYAIGGIASLWPFNTVEEYDPATDTWTTKTPMPTARYGMASDVIDGKIYTIGGYNRRSPWENHVEVYDPVNDTWSSRADIPAKRVTRNGVVINGKIYAYKTGYNYASIEEYDPATDTWTHKTELPRVRLYAALAAVNGKIYVVGGNYWIGEPLLWGPPVDTVEEYDPGTDTWTTKAPIPSTIISDRACVFSDKIYVMGGVTNVNYVSLVTSNSVEEYDPATDTWTTLTSMPTNRGSVGCAIVDGKIYFIGGYKGGYVHYNIVEEYTLPQ